MRRIIYLFMAILLLAGCVPSMQSPTSVATPIPTATTTVIPISTSTNSPTIVPALSTATITPMTVVPMSASPLRLTEFNAGTEMKRLSVIGTGTPHAIAFSADGKLFAVATERGVYLYDGTTFEQKSFIDVNDSVSAIAFSPDGDTLAVAVNGKAGLWNVLSGQKLQEFQEGMIYISKLAYGRGGYVAAIGGDCRGCGEPVGAMILWNAKTGRRIYAEREIWYDTRALTFSADGTRLVYGGMQGIRAIESRTGRFFGLYSGITNTNFPYDLMFIRDEAHFIISAYVHGETTVIHDIVTRAETDLPECRIYIAQAAGIGACSNEKSITLIDGGTGQKIKTFDIDVDENTLKNMFVLSPDGRFLVYYGKYGISILETETGNKIKTLNFNDFVLAQAGISAIGGNEKYTAAVISSFGRVEIYDLQTGNVLRTLKSDCCAVGGFAFAPDHKTVATVDEGDHLILWDLQSGKVVHQMTLKDYERGPIVFSPDGTSLFFIKESAGEVLEFVFTTGKTITHRTDNFSHIGVDDYTNDNLHFNAVGNLIMLGFQDGNPSFEEAKTGNKIVVPFEAMTDADIDLRFAFSPAQQFLSMGVLGKILVWDLETHKVLSTLVGHETRGGDGWEGTIRSLIMSPKSNLLVSVGWDSTTRLWNIPTGTELRRLNLCCSTSFTPDGRYLITAGEGVIRVWGIPQ